MSVDLILRFLNQFAQDVAILVLPTVAIFAVRYVKQEWKRLHIPGWLVTYADMAIRASEQSHMNELITDKKGYAIEALQALLNAHGVKLDAKALDAAIEDAVHNANAETVR